MVVKPIEGTPAYYGKVQPDDVILAVNGKSASGWSLNDAVDRITGPPGTAVSITIRRKTEEEPITITLTRNSIKLHSVHGWWKKDLDEEGQPNWGWYIDPTNKIGYIKLSNFSLAASEIAPCDSGSSISPSPQKTQTFLSSLLTRPRADKYRIT